MSVVESDREVSAGVESLLITDIGRASIVVGNCATAERTT